MENIASYSPWLLKTPHGTKLVEVEEIKHHGQGLVVRLKGVDDRDQALQYTAVDIAVDGSQFEPLPKGEYYWHQLQGLSVISEYAGQTYRFGKVRRLMETGANDVLVVAADTDSIDDRERLVPYVPDQYIKAVDLAAGEIRVLWDPEF